MACDTCGRKFQAAVRGERYCSTACAPKWRTCACENPIEDDDTCLRCGRFLLPPARPKRAGRLVPPR